MSGQKGADPSQSPDDAAVTAGFGGPVTGQDGHEPSKENQHETGGSGGDGLTRNDVIEVADKPKPPTAAKVPQPTGSAAVARGFQDTRAEQAGATETGLGTPETGANQDADDLEHRP